MKSIRIFDKNINLLAEIDNYESLEITRKFNKIGEFELRISSNRLHTEKLVKNNLILFHKDFNKVGIILHREFGYSQGKESTDLLIVKGCLLNGLVGRRIVIPNINDSFMSFNGSQEQIIKSFVEMNLIKVSDPSRKINNLKIMPNLNRGTKDSWRCSYKLLSDLLNEICEYSGLGWNITLDVRNKKFLFDVIESRDLTINQKERQPVIFRSDFNNIITRQYIESIINNKNVVYSGTKEDAEKLVLSTGEVSGFERIETFIDCNSDDPDELKKAASIKLKELEELKTFVIDVRPNSTFIYEENYDLGDIVTIQDRKLKVTMDSKIVEVKESHTPKTTSIKLTFGKSIPDLLTKIKWEVK